KKSNIILFGTLLFGAMLLNANGTAQTQADSMLSFISRTPEKSSLHLVVNDTVVAAFRENTEMPLASTMKLLVALEFAKQAAAGLVDTGKTIALRDLNRYHIAFTDGNSHPKWL